MINIYIHYYYYKEAQKAETLDGPPRVQFSSRWYDLCIWKSPPRLSEVYHNIAFENSNVCLIDDGSLVLSRKII